MDLKIFYNHNVLINTDTEIKTINNYYKNHFVECKDFNTFIAPIQTILQKNPLLTIELQKQFIQKKGLQSGILTEINIFTTIAQALKITNFIEQNGQYIGENNIWKIVLQGNLAHGGNHFEHDLTIYNKESNQTFFGEIKEPLARATDCDVRYDEQGRIYKTPRGQANLNIIKDFIDYYNTNITIFSHIGHNYQIKPEDCVSLFLNYFKDIDYLFTYIENKLIVIPRNSDILTKIYSLKGSEIRGTGGKNPVSIFTPEYFKRTIKPFVVNETEITYTLIYGNSDNEIHPVKGRGHTNITRFTIPYGFMFRVSDIIEQTENTITISKNKIKQLNANISVHIQLSSDYEFIKNIVLGGNKNDK